MKDRHFTLLVILLFAVFISGCASSPTDVESNAGIQDSDSVKTQEIQVESESSQETISTSSDDFPQKDVIQQDNTEDDDGNVQPADDAKPEEESIPAPTPTAILIPTREVPEDFDWTTLPIIPEISDNVVEIFQNGVEQGRDPNKFSVIGDCQGIPFIFMGPIGRRELLPRNYEQFLWDAIYQFEDSFLRESITVRGGFTAASLFNPMQADPRECKPGETPITCEYRLYSPAYIFITLENWRDEDTIDRYESYLREILEYVIQHGTVPILITKADVSEVKERIHIINPVMAKLAYEYDIPLVNFWRGAQSLPNRGIDPEREGFHLSQEGYDLKNLLALNGLYEAWQKVESAALAAVADEPEVTPSVETAAKEPLASPTPTPIPSVELIANPDCPDGCVYFGLVQSEDGDINMQGVFAYQFGDEFFTQILPAGFDLQDINPDGKHLLVNQENLLYIVNLTDSSTELVSSNFFYFGEQTAYWAGNGPDAEIIQLNEGDASIAGDTGSAFRLFSAGRNDTIFFESGSCDSKDRCTSEGVYQQFPDQEPVLLENTLRPVFSPDGNWYAFTSPEAKTLENHGNANYFLMQDPDQGIISRKVIYLLGRPGFRVFPDVRTFAFSPQSDALIIFYDIYSVYFQKSLSFETFLIDLKTNMLIEYGEMPGGFGSFRPKLVWSPNGEKILFFLIDVNEENQYFMNIYETIVGTEDRLIPVEENIHTSQKYFYITNIGWQSP